MITFSKQEIELLRALADNLVSMTELETDEQEAVNKFYAFLDEQTTTQGKCLP